MCCILSLTNVDERMRLAPMAGHWAPWPVKIPRIRGAMPRWLERRPTGASLAFASLASIPSASFCIDEAAKETRVECWLFRACSVHARLGAWYRCASGSLRCCEYCWRIATRAVSVCAENTKGEKPTDVFSASDFNDGVYASRMA
jgi:hypothetical protein